MRIATIEKKIFSLDDVLKDEKLKEKVLKKNSGINVDFYQWYGCVVEEWQEKLEKFGFVNPDISFSGFWNQGDGASFTSENIYVDAFLSYFGDEIFSRREIDFINRLMKDYDLFSFAVKRKNFHYCHEKTVSVTSDEYLYHFSGKKRLFNFLENSFTKIENLIAEKVEEFSRKIYRELEKEYDYLTSEEAIIETISANDHEFTEDGAIA